MKCREDKTWQEKLIEKYINTVRWRRGESEDFIGTYNTILNYPIINEDYGQFTGGVESKTYLVGIFHYQCIWWDGDKYPNEIVRTRIEDAL